MRLSVLILIGLLIFPMIVLAGEADVVKVAVERQGDRYRFDVTVLHDDGGWQHYADGWDVVAPDGQIIATRVLYHPHVNEQPFTRSLSGVVIDPEIASVTIRAHDLVHGYGGEEKIVKLPK